MPLSTALSAVPLPLILGFSEAISLRGDCACSFQRELLPLYVLSDLTALKNVRSASWGFGNVVWNLALLKQKETGAWLCVSPSHAAGASSEISIDEKGRTQLISLARFCYTTVNAQRLTASHLYSYENGARRKSFLEKSTSLSNLYLTAAASVVGWGRFYAAPANCAPALSRLAQRYLAIGLRT